MDVPDGSGGVGTGGRRKSIRRRRRKAEIDKGADNTIEVARDETTAEVVTKKEEPSPSPSPVQPQKLILAPKKKSAKVVLVSPPKAVKKRSTVKIFKARRIRFEVDNTARTLKKRKQLHNRIDSMTTEQLREAVVAARLAKPQTLEKAPLELLRGLLRDYHSLRGGLL